MRVRWGKVAWFLGVTFVMSWGLIAIMYVLGWRLQQPFAALLLIPYMFVPALGAVFVQRVMYREPVIRPLGVAFRLNWWFLAAWVIPPLLALAAFGVSLLFPDIAFSPGMDGLFRRYGSAFPPEDVAQARQLVRLLTPAGVLLIGIAQGMVAGVTVNAVAAFGEELGWRGLLLREVAKLGFWPAALIIGVVWGIWHAPIIWQGYNYPEHPRLGVAMMTGFTLLFTPLIIYVTLRARSVIAAAVMHGTFNGVAGLSFVFLDGGSDLTAGILGAAGFITLALANIVLVLYDRYLAKDPLMGRRALFPYRDDIP